MNNTLPLSLRLLSGLRTATDPAPPLHRLEPGAVRTIHCLGGRLVRVQAGRLWITQPNDPADHFLAPGDSLQIRGDGPVVMQCDSVTPALFSS